MINLRSIHIRLIAWYSGLVMLVSLAFGAYVYQGVGHHMYGEFEQIFTRRLEQIANYILPHVTTSPATVASLIEDVYAPEVTDRFIRILGPDHTVLYLSGAPREGDFNPAYIPVPEGVIPERRIVKIAQDQEMMIVALPATVAGKPYTIEMGAPMSDVDDAQGGLIIALIFGLPVVVLIVSAGGYMLVRRALQPVENIRATAQQITFGNLSNRLPVATTGDALENLSVTLNRMLDRLEHAYEQSRRFSADASHELRTPLTIMRGELESIVREPQLPRQLEERIGSVLEETERLSRITESLFAISRLDAGEARAELTRFDLSALAQATAEQMALLAEEKHIALRIEAEPIVPVHGDATRLKQVVVNLLDNAIKYTPEGGRITLRVTSEENKAVLEVSDNGIGIAVQALPHVFERFYRTDRARSREQGGAGLGLSIVRSICQAHGGSVEIESQEGKGTICRVELPLAEMIERKGPVYAEA